MEFRECVLTFVGFADPKQNDGVTLEQTRPSIGLRIEEPDITTEYAKSLGSDFPRDTIVAGLEAGGEEIARESLILFVVCESDALKIAVYR